MSGKTNNLQKKINKPQGKTSEASKALMLWQKDK